MSDTPRKFQNSKKWRKDFAALMRREREQSGLTTTEQCPKGGDYQEQIETAERVPELSYLLRLMMWLQEKDKPLPSQRGMRMLLILWCLARIESLIETDDVKFKEQVVKDYEETIPKPQGDKKALEEYKNEISRVFDKNWRQSALKAQQYFHDILYPVYEGLDRMREQKGRDAPNGLPTLDSFPEAFKPLVIVVGGYGGQLCREPEHVSELFRQSQSFVNLHYLLSLNLDPDTEIVSDRLLLEMSGDRQRADELLGEKHILFIGSPLVNAFSRHLILNKKLIFNFVFRKETYRLGRDFYDEVIEPKLLETAPALSMFYRLMETEPARINISSSEYADVKKADREQIKDTVFKIRDLTGDPGATNEDVTNQFRPHEMFSPFEPKLQDAIGDSYHEFAVISLAENLWAKLLRKKTEPPKFASIFVAGMNELSSTLAVKELGRKEALKWRPLGGLLEVQGGRSPALKHITGSRAKWLTRPYQAVEVLKKVDEVLKSFDERPSAFTFFESRDELEAYREIVNQYIPRKP